MEKREPSFTVGGNANLYIHYGKQMWRFLKNLEIELPYDPEIPLLGIHTEETRIERHVYPNVHRSTVYKSGHGSNLDVRQQMNG